MELMNEGILYLFYVKSSVLNVYILRPRHTESTRFIYPPEDIRYPDMAFL
jgi:hypothetical protein